MKTPLITKEGLEKLKAELDHLWRVERPDTTQKVSWAASLGDRSENADYGEVPHTILIRLAATAYKARQIVSTLLGCTIFISDGIYVPSYGARLSSHFSFITNFFFDKSSSHW